MATQCILCQNNPPIENSHVVPKFIVRYLKDQSPVSYLKHSWDYNKKLQDGWKGAHLCAECDNETVSEWEGHFKKNWFTPFIVDQKDELFVDEKILYFLLSLLFRYSEFFIERNPSRSDSHLPVNLQNQTRGLLINEECKKIGSEFYIYSAFVHPIIDNKNFLPGINQLLFNSYNGILLPPEGKLPSITLIWIPSFLFIFSETALDSVDEIKALNICNSLELNKELKTNFQNWDLLYLVKSVLNKQVNNMNVSQKKQRKEDFNKLKELFQKDSVLHDRMSDKARNWDEQLNNYCLSEE